jgi:hypothetical protein
MDETCFRPREKKTILNFVCAVTVWTPIQKYNMENTTTGTYASVILGYLFLGHPVQYL